MEHDRRYLYLLNAAQKNLSRYIKRHVSNSAGISATQAGALFAIRAQDGALSGEVACALDIAPSAMTGLADRMVKSAPLNIKLTQGFTDSELEIVSRWLHTVNERYKSS